jgi:hypothetical protein
MKKRTKLIELSPRFIARAYYVLPYKAAKQLTKQFQDDGIIPVVWGEDRRVSGAEWEGLETAPTFILDQVQLIPADKSVTPVALFGNNVVTANLLDRPTVGNVAEQQFPLQLTASELEILRSIEVYDLFPVTLRELAEYAWDF